MEFGFGNLGNLGTGIDRFSEPWPRILFGHDTERDRQSTSKIAIYAYHGLLGLEISRVIDINRFD